jgi:hypothetical protein
MSLWSRFTGWYRKDTAERVGEGVDQDSEAARDEADKDYESFKDDQSIGGSYVGGPGIGADFERDSERPRY